MKKCVFRRMEFINEEGNRECIPVCIASNYYPFAPVMAERFNGAGRQTVSVEFKENKNSIGQRIIVRL